MHEVILKSFLHKDGLDSAAFRSFSVCIPCFWHRPRRRGVDTALSLATTGSNQPVALKKRAKDSSLSLCVSFILYERNENSPHKFSPADAVIYHVPSWPVVIECRAL